MKKSTSETSKDVLEQHFAPNPKIRCSKLEVTFQALVPLNQTQKFWAEKTKPVISSRLLQSCPHFQCPPSLDQIFCGQISCGQGNTAVVKTTVISNFNSGKHIWMRINNFHYIRSLSPQQTLLKMSVWNLLHPIFDRKANMHFDIKSWDALMKKGCAWRHLSNFLVEFWPTNPANLLIYFASSKPSQSKIPYKQLPKAEQHPQTKSASHLPALFHFFFDILANPLLWC